MASRSSRKRPAQGEPSHSYMDNRTPTPPAAKQPPSSASAKDAAKPFRGLRHFSLMVCKNVEEKGTTSYNEVADELVRQVVKERRKEEPNGRFDEKNIRRRVYDALNVLMAMDIISKDKKQISWNGLPTSAHQDIEMLEREREFKTREILRKRQALKELVTQQVCFRNLVEHNHRRMERAADGEEINDNDHKIQLPFIVVNTQSSATIECHMSRDQTDVMLDFSAPFEINDDNTILKRLGMHKATENVVEDMLPDDILLYCRQHNLLSDVLSPGVAAHLPADPPPPVTPGSGPL